MISVIINSAALGTKSRDGLSSVGTRYGDRAEVLHKEILPSLIAGGVEVIVVGEFEPGPGYTYVPSPSVAFNCTDALQQRADGFEASHGEVVVFQHDDHQLSVTQFLHTLQTHYLDDPEWDVLVPERYAAGREGAVRLDDGRPDGPTGAAYGGYVMGHACVMRREIARRVPWTNVEKVFTWDVSHTALLRTANARIRWVKDLVVWDLEKRAAGYGW